MAPFGEYSPFSSLTSFTLTPAVGPTPPRTPPLQLSADSSEIEDMGDALPELRKAAVVFPSHVRRSFSRAPTDFTGDLVRLMDDLSTVTHNIAAYVAIASETTEYGASQNRRELDAVVATKQLYKSLSHDGYACILLEKHHEMPLNLPEDAPYGDYVVMLNALDTDDCADHAVCGTMWSVYKRRSSPSLPGKLKDLQQSLSEQVAAGYVVYSSATTLFYSLNQGAFSFVLHPVATQYFLQPRTELRIKEGCADVYADSGHLKSNQLNPAIRRVTESFEPRGSLFDSGCFLANFHGAATSGGVVLAFDVHLLCEAGAMALIIEQMGGKATNTDGERILGTLRASRTACFPFQKH